MSQYEMFLKWWDAIVPIEYKMDYRSAEMAFYAALDIKEGVRERAPNSESTPCSCDSGWNTFNKCRKCNKEWPYLGK